MSQNTNVSADLVQALVSGALLLVYRNRLAAYEADKVQNGHVTPLTYSEIRQYLNTWERQLVSVNGLHEGSTVAAAFDME